MTSFMQRITVFGPPQTNRHLFLFCKLYFIFSGIYLAVNKNSISKAGTWGEGRKRKEGKRGCGIVWPITLLLREGASAGRSHVQSLLGLQRKVKTWVT